MSRQPALRKTPPRIATMPTFTTITLTMTAMDKRAIHHLQPILGLTPPNREILPYRPLRWSLLPIADGMVVKEWAMTFTTVIAARQHICALGRWQRPHWEHGCRPHTRVFQICCLHCSFLQDLVTLRMT